MSAGWFFLAAMVGCYGVANLLQSIGAANTASHQSLNPKLLVRLARNGTYVAGLSLQTLGSIFAFVARRDLPLFLVQASVAAGLGVTVVLGVIVLKWRLSKTELALLAMLCLGLAALVASAEPRASNQLGPAGALTIGLVLVALAIAGFFAARLRGVPGSVGLGALAGVAFGAAAVASRPLANVPGLERFITDPLLYLVLAHSLVAQLLLGLAMQKGSTTAAVAAMDAASAVPAAAVGLLFLGDQITPGSGWLAALGFVVTIGTVIGLTFFAQVQHPATGRHRQPDRPVLGGHTRSARRLAARAAGLATSPSQGADQGQDPSRSRELSRR